MMKRVLGVSWVLIRCTVALTALLGVGCTGLMVYSIFHINDNCVGKAHVEHRDEHIELTCVVRGPVEKLKNGSFEITASENNGAGVRIEVAKKLARLPRDREVIRVSGKLTSIHFGANYDCTPGDDYDRTIRLSGAKDGIAF